MNLILFTADEIGRALPRTDPRAAHVLDVLRRKPGDQFDAGLINGPRGKATVLELNASGIALTFTWENPRPAPPPLVLLIGLPRPQTARDILRDATTLGATAIHFVRTAKAEASYAQSTLWSSGEWKRHVIAGAEQAFDTRIPDVTFNLSLAEAITQLSADVVRFGCDNYEAPTAFAQSELPHRASVALALGPERGWAPEDRELLRANGFSLVHLGPRVLRTETAVIAALTLAQSKRDWP